MSMPEEEQGLLTELEITVMKATKNALDTMAKHSELTIGEVVDRLVLKMCPLDVDFAMTLALERIRITFSALSDEERGKALHELIMNMAAFLPSDEIEKLQLRAKNKRIELLSDFADMNDEDRSEIIDELRQLRSEREKEKRLH